jgi:hypothetical protein
MITFVLHHLWWLVAVALVFCALGVVFRRRVKRLVRLVRLAATDERLPKPVRWLFRIVLVAKLWPGPDFGVDELALGLGTILLLTKYRRTWAEIRAELNAQELEATS